MPRTVLFFSISLFLLIFLLSWMNGVSDFPDWDFTKTVLFSIRLPRLLAASLCGASLSCAGVLSQGLFRNPLASPSVLGASAGGVLGAVCVYYFVSPWYHWLLVPAAAFAGTLLTMFFVLKVFKGFAGGNSSQLLLCGFAISTLLGALSSLVISFLLPQVEKASSLMQWMMGTFNGRSWEHLYFAAPPAFLGFIGTFALVRQLDILTFGEELAHSLNVNVSSLQTRSIIAIALLVGSSVSVAGALPFVGLIVPHLTRSLTGPVHRFLVPCSLVNGMLLMVLADLFAQKILFPRELEVGILTSLLGVIFFFAILLRKQHDGL